MDKTPVREIKITVYNDGSTSIDTKELKESSSELTQIRIMRLEYRAKSIINFGDNEEISKVLPLDRLITLRINDDKPYEVLTHKTIRGRLVGLNDIFNKNLVGAGTKLICKYVPNELTLYIRTED